MFESEAVRCFCQYETEVITFHFISSHFITYTECSNTKVVFNNLGRDSVFRKHSSASKHELKVDSVDSAAALGCDPPR